MGSLRETNMTREPINEAHRIARIYLDTQLAKFVRSIPEAEQKDFFDGRDVDMWQREFAHFLLGPREFASND